MFITGNNNKVERLSTVSLYIGVACFVKKIMLSISKAADLNLFVKVGLWYRAFPSSKGSLSVESAKVCVMTSCQSNGRESTINRVLYGSIYPG